MEIKKIFTKSGQFIYNRFIEVIGITISIFSILLLLKIFASNKHGIPEPIKHIFIIKF